MRIRDHNKADLALAALTLSVAAAAAVSEAVRWTGGRIRRRRNRSAPSRGAESMPPPTRDRRAPSSGGQVD